jgi:hypothetical protein
MSENIQQSFIYKNKTYKTLGAAQGARIRSINKDIIKEVISNYKHFLLELEVF